MKKCLNDPVFKVISQVITREKVKGYLIGGFVRDCILERNMDERDLDIVVIGDGIGIAKKVADELGII